MLGAVSFSDGNRATEQATVSARSVKENFIKEASNMDIVIIICLAFVIALAIGL